jgi:DNA-binding MarR family transcriptional regulator
MTVNQRKMNDRPRLTKQEKLCLEALSKLKKEWRDERPPLAEVAQGIGASLSTASQLLKSLSLKGYVKETFEVFA